MKADARILIVKLSSLGDVIHTLPVLHDLRRALPQAQIDWVVEPGFAPLVRRAAGLHRVIECPQRRWRQRGLAGLWAPDVRAEKARFRADLRAEAYDLVLDLQGLTKSALVARQARLSPDGERVAMANRTDGSGYEAPTRWLADRAIRMTPHSHALDRARALAGQAIGVRAEGPPDFGLAAPQTQATGPAAMPCVVFVHGTSRDDKLWPEDHWVALGRRFLAAGWRIALPHGGGAEAERAARLRQALLDAPPGVAAAAGPAVEIWPLSALDVLLDRMAATQGVIGVDSGLSHLAVALNLCHVQLYNFPTAWRTGPQASHGHRHQCSLEGVADGRVPAASAPLPPPTVDAVWQAWQRCREAHAAALLAARSPAQSPAQPPAHLLTPSPADPADPAWSP